MSTFSYTIRTTEGKTLKGTLTAASETDALLKVRKLGGVALEVKEKGAKKKPGTATAKVPLKEKIILTEQLAVMLNAGVTLVQALHGLQEESSNKAMAALLGQIASDVETGLPFSRALEKHPKAFTRIFCEMVRSSEKTGNLADTLTKLTHQQQKEYDLKGKVRGAFMYPAVIFTLLVVVVIMVLTFILPKITVLFTDSGAELPLSTRFLMALSDFLINQWYILLALLVVGVFAFRASLRTPGGRWKFDSFILKVPVVGSFVKKTYMARFCQSFASLAQAGVPVLETFQTLKGVVGNVVYEKEITQIARDVENGVKVSTAIRKSRYFPAMIGQFVSVGEQSGDLAGIFDVLGTFFEKEVDGMAKNLSTLLEPIIMIVMGAVVGFILVSVLQPIYGLVNVSG